MTSDELNNFATSEIRRFLVFLAEKGVPIEEEVLKSYEQKFSIDKNIFRTSDIGFNNFYKANFKE